MPSDSQIWREVPGSGPVPVLLVLLIPAQITYYQGPMWAALYGF